MPNVIKTATTPTTCGCCAPPSGPCFPGAFSCRSKGGTATLCGFNEWTGFASVPPKKYKKLAQGGGYVFTNYTAAGCTTLSGSGFFCNWTGECFYTLPGCVETLNGIQNCGLGNVQNCGNLGGDFPPGSPDTITTSTLVQAIVTGACRFNGITWGKYTAANQFAQLSDEDTDALAIARLMADAVWSPFSDTIPACTAKWETRTTGFTIAYQEVEWQIFVAGLAPDTGFAVQMNYFRRVFGSGPFELFMTETVYGYSDGGGALLITGVVPNEEGFETYVQQGPCA
jgi:hypothetical protein